ncbi:MAG: hypothetical protein AAF940_01830 [Pseudomonadota bacterium]
MGAAGMLLGCAMLPCADAAVAHPAFLPDADDFRMQRISRLATETNWPFTVDEGLLLCTYVLGDPAVYFAVTEDGDASDTRILILADNVFDLAVLNFFNADLFVEQIDPARRLEMVRPYFEIGARLCDQPRGTTMPSGEL